MSAAAKGDVALRALAEALAPLVAEILREQAGPEDDGLADLLAAAGFELDDGANDRGKGAA